MFLRNIRLRLSFAFILAAQLVTACEMPRDEGPAAALQEPAASANSASGNEYANPDVLVDTEWVLANHADPGVRLIDVSSRAEVYEEGRLPGASFVQWNTELVNSDNPVEGQILTGDALSELMSGLGVQNDAAPVTAPSLSAAGNPLASSTPSTSTSRVTASARFPTRRSRASSRPSPIRATVSACTTSNRISSAAATNTCCASSPKGRVRARVSSSLPAKSVS